MDESEKRRERLRAMRMDAAQAEVSNNVQASNFSGLSNPLVESSATVPEQEEFCATPKFDFYTDPMSAFSANKRRSAAGKRAASDNYAPSYYSGSPASHISPQMPGVRHPQTPSPAHQFHSNCSPNHEMYHARGLGPYRSPIGMANRPFTGNTATYNYRNSFANPAPGHIGSSNINTAQNRGMWVNHSPTPSPGRGGGGWRGNFRSPGSVQGTVSRLGSQGRGNSLGPGQLFNESMLEDPWKFLRPGVWKSLKASVNNSNTPASSKSWISRSIGTKKPRVSESLDKSSSQPSLAEYLAASFNETINEAPNT